MKNTTLFYILFPAILAAGVLMAPFVSAKLQPAAVKPVGYKVKLDVVSDGYESEYCWFHPHAGAIPGPTPTVVLTMQKFYMPQSDAFLPIQSQQTRDFGKTWSPLIEQKTTLGRTPQPDDTSEGVSDFTPKWNVASGRLIGTGQTLFYAPGNKLISNHRRSAIWSVYEPKTGNWTKWQALQLPDAPEFWIASAGSTQRVDLKNGNILLPLYCRAENASNEITTVARCRFEDGKLRYIEHGTELSVDTGRGLSEASLAHFHGKFYMTMRNDLASYYSVSDDGLHYSAPRKWTFDDGQELGSANTQTRWVTHSKGLFLVYTRSGAHNDNVFRHRAPLFMAQVDAGTMCVLRATERVLVPNLGAQLGNYGVTDVNAHETWITTSEGMAPGNPHQYGANGRVYAARILWDEPNKDWDRH